MSDSEKRPVSGDKAPKAPAKNPGFFKRRKDSFSKWFREMRSELKKVVWPTRKQILNNTWVVILSVIFVGICIALFDQGTHLLVEFLIGLGPQG